MKKDWVHSILKLLDHERYKIILPIVAIVLAYIFLGCTPEIISPISGEDVTRQEFRIELLDEDAAIEMERAKLALMEASLNSRINIRNEKAASAEEEFVKKEEFNASIVEIGGGVITTVASGGTVNLASLLPTLLTIGFGGAAAGGVVDSLRKNKVIKEAKNQ